VSSRMPEHASFLRKAAFIMGWDALKALAARGYVFVPLFAALALSAGESQWLGPCRVPFLHRTYGWAEKDISALLGPLLLLAMLAGITVGGLFVTSLRQRDKGGLIAAHHI